MNESSLESPSRIREALKKSSQFRILGQNMDEWIHYLFGGNAAVSIVVLLLIMLLLFKEGLGFLPQNLDNLRVYRHAGLEYVDYVRTEVDGFTKLGRDLNQLRLDEVLALQKQGRSLEEINASLGEFDAFNEKFSDVTTDLNGILSDQTELASGLKERVLISDNQKQEIQMLLGEKKTEEAAKLKPEVFDFAKETQPLRDMFPQFQEANRNLERNVNGLLSALPKMPNPDAEAELQKFAANTRALVATLPDQEKEMQAWDVNKPVPMWKAVTSFLFGPRWLTASFWQDWYGVVPLFVGSLLISIVAMAIAVPFSIFAAIYINQIASSKEQSFIKPYIEFISAIPSVVLGFFGVAVLGSGLRSLSNVSWLQWVPGFPMSERLTILTAGCLLALMAVPTIFSLAEDALNNVPRHFTEASLSLGATKWQTIIKIMFPSALSGIISAVLLGFGRVIGETMVVLLCAGNRIEIPDFSAGLGAFVQPAHTMTGIIAQEMGEVVQGSIHYRALFMVGMALFFISLLINYLAQLVVRKFRIVG
ncbi:MAG TPA: phosphate ABC transporter permease subunit PstC [Chthoniobacterales bacterium]